jgi:hypothetical protein
MRKRPLKVIMEDEITHTVNAPVCSDETCICAQLEYEQLCASKTPRKRPHRKPLVERDYSAFQLNGDRSFRILR